jgi:hypothetical protein
VLFFACETIFLIVLSHGNNLLLIVVKMSWIDQIANLGFDRRRACGQDVRTPARVVQRNRSQFST